MPSNEEKKPGQETGKVVAFKAKKEESGADVKPEKGAVAVKKPRKHLGIGWWFGIIVLILISISFVLAPTLEAVLSGKQGSGLVFGTYGKEEIKFLQGNYFYDQYQYYANQYKSSSETNSTQAVYQIWRSAFESTVIYTAVNQMAKKAGIIASNAVVNRKIIDGGYYNKDGKFDAATYNAATAEQKSSVETSVRRTVPMQIVVNDIASVLSSNGEQDFVAAMADDSKAFEYVAFDSTSYPDEKASQYALQNPQLFAKLDISMINAATEDEAKAIYGKINDKSQTFEEAATTSSTDSYASANGKVGSVYFFQLNSMFKNTDDAQKLFTANSGDVIGPFEGTNTWTIYRLDNPVTQADFADATTLSMVKSYMSAYETTLIDEYLSGEAKTFYDTAKASTFEDAVDKDGLTINEVGATPLNVGGSSYLGSFSYSDQKGLLTAISTDSDKMKTLYTSETGAVTEPMKSGSSYLVAKVGEKGQAGTGSYLKTFYSYMSSSNSQQDLAQSIMSSDQLKDDFLNVFLTNILGVSSSTKS